MSDDEMLDDNQETGGKKKKKSEGGISFNSDTIDAHLHKKFGDDVFIGGNVIIDKPKRILPISPALDLITHRVTEGTIMLLAGPRKVGKTSLSLDFAATAQQPENDSEYGPRKIYYFDVEGRIKSRDLTGIHHLITTQDRFEIIRSRPGKILVAEDYLEILEAYTHTKPGSILLMDSFSQLCSSSRMNSAVGNRFRDDVPLMLADLTKRLSNVVPINCCVIIGITHMIANQDPYSQRKWTEASGNKIQYASDTKLRATHCEPYMDGEVQIGQVIHWCCEWSSIGPPGGKAESLLRYGYGIDKEYELISLAKDLALIDVNGSWYNFDKMKVQGIEKACSYIKENPKVYKQLCEKFNEVMGFNVA